MLSSLYKVVDEYVVKVRDWIDAKLGKNVRVGIVWLLLFLAGLLSGYGVGPSLDKANVEQPKLEQGE